MQIRLAMLVFTYWSAQAMLFPLIAPYAASLGASSSLIAVLIAFQALPALFLAVPLGNLVDVWSVKGMLIGCGAIAAVSILFVPLIDRPELLFLTQAGIGCGGLGMWIALQSLMITPPPEASTSRFDTQIANISTAAIAGQLFGPVASGWLGDLLGLDTTYIVVAGVCALGLLFSFRLSARSPGAIRHRPRQLLDSSLRSYARAFKLLSTEAGMGVAVMFAFAIMYLTSIVSYVYPLYFTSINVSLSEIGLVLSVGSAASLASRAFVVRLASRLNRAILILSVLVPGSIATCSIGLVSGLAAYLALSVLSGLALGAGQTLTLSLTADAASDMERGVSVALRMVANRAAQSITPLAFAGMLTVIDFPMVFVVNGILMLGFAAIIFSVLRKR